MRSVYTIRTTYTMMATDVVRQTEQYIEPYTNIICP